MAKGTSSWLAHGLCNVTPVVPMKKPFSGPKRSLGRIGLGLPDYCFRERVLSNLRRNCRNFHGSSCPEIARRSFQKIHPLICRHRIPKAVLRWKYKNSSTRSMRWRFKSPFWYFQLLNEFLFLAHCFRRKTVTIFSNIILYWILIGRMKQGFDSDLLQFDTRLLRVCRSRSQRVGDDCNESGSYWDLSSHILKYWCRESKAISSWQSPRGCAPLAFLLLFCTSFLLNTPVRLSLFDLIFHLFNLHCECHSWPYLYHSSYQIRNNSPQMHVLVMAVVLPWNHFFY